MLYGRYVGALVLTGIVIDDETHSAEIVTADCGMGWFDERRLLS
jgi:hypothetical protein